MFGRILVLMCCLLSACSVPGKVCERQLMAMGTSLQVTVIADTSAVAEAAAEAAVRAIEAAEQRFSNWRQDSMVSRVNEAPVGQTSAVDDAFRRGLRLALAWSQKTGGAFDPASGALVELWGGRRGGVTKTPDREAIRMAAATGGEGALRITKDGVARLHRGVQIATGGFAKGAALDDAVRAAKAAGAHSAIFDLGGQLRWFGTRPGEVAIANPDNRDHTALWLELHHSGSLATSGNSERALKIGDQRASHIFDPRTGWPAKDIGSVTVFATGDDAGCAADSLSTALFVLGWEAGLERVEKLPSVEALYIFRKHEASDGLPARFHPYITTGMQSLISRHPFSF